MAELIDVVNAMFKQRNSWKNISKEDKEKNFFIINRFLSKKYPTKAQFLNIKTVDKSVSLDLWFNFMINEPYPSWFWSKSQKMPNEVFDKKDFSLLMEKLQLNKSSDLEYLIDNHQDFIKEELKFYKSKIK